MPEDKTYEGHKNWATYEAIQQITQDESTYNYFRAKFPRTIKDYESGDTIKKGNAVKRASVVVRKTVLEEGLLEGIMTKREIRSISWTELAESIIS